MTQLIGITGKAHHGKDTLANVFAAKGFKRLAFANALKLTCSYIAREEKFLWFNEETKEEFCPALGMTRRQALQKVGGGLRDTLGPDIWINRLLDTWVKRRREPAVISDVRYENEARAIRKLGGVIIRVVRPIDHLTGDAASHPSEAGIPDDLVDIEIYNDGTIAELEAEGRKVLASLTQEAL